MKPKISELNLTQSEHFFNIRTEIDIRRERVNEEAYRDPLASGEKIQKISNELIEMVNLAENDLKLNMNRLIFFKFL